MKTRRREAVYRLFDTHDLEESPRVYFRTKLTDDELVMLMKVWMYKLDEEEHAACFSNEEMMELLTTFGCRQVDPQTDGFRSYYEANTFEIWEAANIRPTDEDMNNPEYYNEQAQKIMLKAAEEYRNFNSVTSV